MSASPDGFAGASLTCVRGERLVFRNLDFTLAPGQALLLHGANGSGKSSLLRLMAGLLPAAAGTLTWHGTPVRDDPEGHRARLHYVGHLDGVKPVLTAAEMLASWAALRGQDGDVRSALDALGIANLADVPGRFLSAGQRRRVALARLVAAPAPLWLLDEPTVGLDRDGLAALAALLERHLGAGGLAAIATHADVGLKHAEVLDVAAFADRDAA